jgi:two-component system sensor histidine kinase RpfC
LSLLRKLEAAWREGADPERRQSFARLILALSLALAFGVAAAWLPDRAEFDRATAVALGALLYAIALHTALIGHPEISQTRRTLALIGDVLLIASMLAVGDGAAAPLYVLLVWAALDHGLRYGARPLWSACVLATLAFAVVIAIDPFWRAALPLAAMLAALPCLLPIALAPLWRSLLQARAQTQQARDSHRRLLLELERDFRAPLDSIVGVSKTLFATRLSPEQREGNEFVQGSAQALLRRIGDALDLAALEAGGLHPQLTDFNLRESAARVRNQLQPLAGAKGVSLLVEVDDAIPLRLRGDARRVTQLLARLLQRALDRTSEGSVRATVRRLPDDGGRAWLRLSVRDTGSEFELDLPALRSASRPAPVELVGALSTLLGGRCGCEPNLGGGMHAWVELPFGVPAALPETECFAGETKVVSFDDPLVRHRARIRPLRVLLADESSANRLVLQRLLQRAGHEVVLADDGEQALDRIEGGEADAAFVHLRLAGMSGLDVLRHARMLQAGGRQIPIALLSADAATATVREAEAAGAFAFLTKPVVVSRLLEVLGAMSETVRGVAVPSPEPPVAAIGLDVVQELMALDLGEGFVAGFVEQCLRDAGHCMAEMDRCGAAAEWEGMREAAHALKGLSQNFAARAVAEACDDIVRGSDALLRSDWRRRVAQLDGLLQACWRQVRSEMARLAIAPAPRGGELEPGGELR